MAELEIIGVPFSNFVWAVRACCVAKGVEYRLNPALPHSPEVKAIHPFGKIPVLRHGEVTLFETRAMIGYIDAVFPGPALLPREAVAMAAAESWMSLLTTTIDQVCMRQYVVQYAFPSGPDGKPDRARIDAAVPQLQRQLRWLDGQLGEGFALPMGFSAVDAVLVPILHYVAGRAEGAAALAERPRVAAYLERLLAHPAMVAAAPPQRPAKS